MKKQDYILLICIFLIGMILLAGYRLWYHAPGGMIEISINGKRDQTLSLSHNTTITLSAGNGHNVLTIRDGCADITDADCPDKLCVTQKKISRKGETLVCLPHKLVVKVIEGTENGNRGPDAISK